MVNSVIKMHWLCTIYMWLGADIKKCLY